MTRSLQRLCLKRRASRSSMDRPLDLAQISGSLTRRQPRFWRTPAPRFNVFAQASRNRQSTRAEPARIEKTVGFAIIRKARDVPMADETRIGFPDRRTAADKDHAIRIARQYLLGFVRGTNFHECHSRPGPIRKRGDSPRAGNQHVTAGQSEEPRHIGLIFCSRISFPRKLPIEAELTSFSYRAND